MGPIPTDGDEGETMASYQYDRARKRARIFWRLDGRQFNKVERVVDERAAQRLVALVEDTIADVERGRLEIPTGADVKAFVVSGGRVVKLDEAAEPEPKGPRTLGELLDAYFATLSAGHKAESSMRTERVHERHLRRLLGDGLAVADLDVAAVQRYADARAKEGVGRETVKKEAATLGFTVRWAMKRKLVADAPEWRIGDLTIAKGREKPPFATLGQIKNRIARGGLSADEEAELWESLWLDQGQTVEFLGWARANARPPFLFPAIAFAAYTGARRSEIVASEVEDWDLAGGTVRIRQKKSDRAKEHTTRDVPIHRDLAEVMKGWFAAHPGGRWAICKEDGSPIRATSLTRWLRELLDVEDGPWSIVRGFHTLRHSLASNLAASGVDQREIDAILGHSTDAMSRRYRHLAPARKRSAVDGLF